MSELSIPASHLDLVTGSAVVTLSTLNGDSSIQCTAIWINHGGDGILRASLATSRQKYRNLLERPYATIFALSGVDPFHSPAHSGSAYSAL